MGNNPVITAAGIAAAVGAVIALLVAFGINLSAVQIAAIMGVVTVVSPFVVAWVGHKTTTTLADPKDEDGTPLVRSVTQAPTIAQTRSMMRK